MIEESSLKTVVVVLLDWAEECLHGKHGTSHLDDVQSFREDATASWRQAAIAAAELSGHVVYWFDSEHGNFYEGRGTRIKLALPQSRDMHRSRHQMIHGPLEVSLWRYTDPDNITWWIVQMMSKNLHVVYESLVEEKARLCHILMLNAIEDLAKGK